MFSLYGLCETLSVAFRHVAKQNHKSSKNIQNLEFSSASVMFIITFECENRVSGNAHTRFIRLLDELNRVVGSIFDGCVGCVNGIWQVKDAERCWNPLKCSQSLTEIARISTARNSRESYVKQIARISIIPSKIRSIDYLRLFEAQCLPSRLLLFTSYCR